MKSGNIPALEVENGEVLTESSIIVDYLDEKYSSNRLYPHDPLQKAKDRLLISHFNKVGEPNNQHIVEIVLII